MNPDLFDLDQGRRLREDGKEAASIRNGKWLSTMRHKARQIATERGTVTSDDIQDFCERLRFWPTHHNAMGAVFKRDEWEAVGWIESRRPSAHARAIRVWRLK